MKVEKLIKDVEKVIDGNEERCKVCTLHEVFTDRYEELVGDDTMIVPLYPHCDKPLEAGTEYGYTSGPVGGSNTVDEKEDIQMCQFWHCEDCKQDYATMPIPIVWNANHDILCTGEDIILPILKKD